MRQNIKSAFTTRRIRWLELTLIAGILFGVLGKDIHSIAFHGDESRLIHSSYFLEPFLRGEFSSPVWGVSYWTLTQPHVTRYIIGVGRRIGGFRATDLNSHWRFGLSDQANIARGAMPSAALLWWARLPMVILAAVSGILLFFLTSKAAGRLAGYVLLLLFILNPYFLTVLRRAMGESPLLVFILLAAFAAYQALRSWQRVEPDAPHRQKRFARPVIWFGLMGVFCGLAAGVKLYGMSVVLTGLGLCVLLPFTQRKIAQAKWYAALCACVLILANGITFIAFNPFLYPNPPKRTQMMLQQRVKEMSAQREWQPSSAIDGSRRIAVIQQRLFERHATLHFPGAWKINLLLCTIGLGYLLYSPWRWVQNPTSSSAGIAMLLVAFASATPALFTPLDWDRYYILPVVFSTSIIAVGIGRVVSGVLVRLCPNWAGLLGSRPQEG